MGLFDNILNSEQSLLKDAESLNYDYIPKLIPYRENEQQYLATCIKPLFSNRSGRNLMIYGAPGIGKSVATKHVLNELQEKTDDIDVIYINCWQHNTSFKILVEICDKKNYKFTQNKKGNELQKIIVDLIDNKPVIFVFDEIDKVEDSDFLYFILEKINHKCVFLITNYKSWLVNLDERIRSRLMPELVEFKEYNEVETKGILIERINYAFFENVWDENSIHSIVKKTFQIKDIRAGLFLLKESALMAEEKSMKKISIDFVNKAIDKLDEFSIKSSSDLNDDEKFILSLIKKHSGLKIGDLFKEYQQAKGLLSYKTFQRKIAKLSEGKYIKITKKHGVGGNTTIIEKNY